MYCGAEVDTVDSEPLDQYSQSFLETLIAPADVPSYEGEPWYPDVKEAADRFFEGDVDECVRVFSTAIDGEDPQVVRAMQDAMANEVVMAVMGPMFEGTPYRGGIMKVAPLLVAENDEDTKPAVLIAGLYAALCDSKACVTDATMMKSVAVSMYSLISDYFQSEWSILDQSSILEDFEEQCTELIIISNEFQDDCNAAVTLDRMRKACTCLYDAINDAVASSNMDVLNKAEAYWFDKDVPEVGEIVSKTMASVLDDGFDGSDEAWVGIINRFKTYVDAYFGVAL